MPTTATSDIATDTDVDADSESDILSVSDKASDSSITRGNQSQTIAGVTKPAKLKAARKSRKPTICKRNEEIGLIQLRNQLVAYLR